MTITGASISVILSIAAFLSGYCFKKSFTYGNVIWEIIALTMAGFLTAGHKLAYLWFAAWLFLILLPPFALMRFGHYLATDESEKANFHLNVWHHSLLTLYAICILLRELLTQ